jgi:phenylalanyl-tRNA synthetase alpha subunit
MVELVHQGQQLAQFAARKAFAREPAEIVTGQVGNFPALVFPIRHVARQQQLQVFGFHRGATLANLSNDVA